ncbi:hypothetical protein ACFX12_005320 [Malus domestica]
MGAGELLLNVGQRCLSFSALAALVRTLALTHVALSEHSNSYRHVKVAWFSRSSNRRKSARQSLKQDVSQPTAVSSANGYPEYTRLLPCPSYNGPPRIEHLVVSEGGPVLEYICKVLDLPLQ